MDIYEYIYGKKGEVTPLVNKETIFTQENQIVNTNIDISTFEILKTIGRGSYGKILVAEYKKSSELYAIKVIRKEQISEDLVDNIFLEKKILSSSKNEFILIYHFFFKHQKDYIL